ncbi:hypothetical protein TrVE_jg1332 [Triparma verrucosa]|uniref:ER membrane protein complex subunit 4 n=1 Tax=Triparma verrucosa TaxID=1606542 RepID=A0A9W7FI82_9STRA|nr:hypothetical protein TrVE_jg1332 [Triparma verrucosa]
MPPGHIDRAHSQLTSSSAPNPSIILAMKNKKAMELALSPGKSLMMTAFMLYMSGSHLNIFTISTTSMALLNPLKGILSTKTQFERFEQGTEERFWTAKSVWIGMNFIALGVGVYKLLRMGLLPNKAGDWGDWIEVWDVAKSVTIL